MDEGISCPISTQGEGTGDADVAFSELLVTLLYAV